MFIHIFYIKQVQIDFHVVPNWTKAGSFLYIGNHICILSLPVNNNSPVIRLSYNLIIFSRSPVVFDCIAYPASKTVIYSFSWPYSAGFPGIDGCRLFCYSQFAGSIAHIACEIEKMCTLKLCWILTLLGGWARHAPSNFSMVPPTHSTLDIWLSLL